jgi:hypothetical protein
MQKIAIAFILLASQLGFCAQSDKVITRYFAFLFEEDSEKFSRTDSFVSPPIIGRFSSQTGHNMIIVSAQINAKESYYVLMSENERNMGYLSWKATGYGEGAREDQAYYLRYDGTDFDYDGW